MISDLDVIRACRDAHACMTPPSSLEALRRRSGATEDEVLLAMELARVTRLITCGGEGLDTARPTQAGLRLLRESE